MPEILVLNPNSSHDVTERIAEALQPLQVPGGAELVCETIAEGPPGIETQAHVDAASGQILDHLVRRGRRPDALVIACFSDPGLQAVRERHAVPAYGIAQCGVLHALALGEPFGILAILETSVPRHLRYLRSLGVADRLAGDLPLDLGVTQLADRTRTFERMVDVGTQLRDRHGAASLVLGCAGLARDRRALQDRLGIPVVDPCQAAVGMARTGLAVGLPTANAAARTERREAS